MRKIIKAFGSKSFIGIGLIMSLLTVLTGGLGYVYQIIMGRQLSPSDFSTLSSVMAVLVIFSAPIGTISAVISRQVSRFNARKNYKILRQWYWKLNFISIAVYTPFILIVAYFSGSLSEYLKLPGQSLIIYAAGFFIVGSLFTLNTAYLQGMQHFFLYSLLGIGGTLIKVALSLFFIDIGLGIDGAFLGIFLSGFLIWIASSVFVTHRLKKFELSNNFDDSKIIIETGFFKILLANTAFTIITQVDVVLVNWYFVAGDAGIYAAASVLGKAILYLPTGIVFTLFAMVAAHDSIGKKHTLLLAQALLLTFVICLCASIFYLSFGSELIKAIYGNGYMSSGNLLGWYGVAMIPMALILVAEHYLMAQGKLFFAWILLIIAPLEIFLIYHFHANLMDVVRIVTLCGFLALAIGVSTFLSMQKKI